MNPIDFYERVNSLKELRDYLDELGRVEGSNVELKGVHQDLSSRVVKPSEIGDFKLLMAKEVSAFANTDAGVIVVGVDEHLHIKNDTQNLYGWLDNNNSPYSRASTFWD